MNRYCPRCGKRTIEESTIDAQEHYYTNNYWKKTIHQCSDKDCMASFLNLDDGSEKRRKYEEQRIRDKTEFERLKARAERGELQ